MPSSPAPRWLLLIHQIPPRPAYLRVKVWRQLQGLGAVAIKSAVYALPRSERRHEELQWVARAIVAGGGDASICEARFVYGLDDGAVESAFRSAREADYAQVTTAARRLALSRPTVPVPSRRRAEVARLRRRLDEVSAIDFFAAPGRAAADELVRALEQPQVHGDANERGGGPSALEPPRGGVWVTRAGVHVDRMASAWLIRRFIDPRARFKFVAAKGYRPRGAELRFDMFEAEFTHQGSLCTFEVLVRRFGLSDAALTPIAEIVHDLDVKDSRYDRPETAGIAALLEGISSASRSDAKRLRRAAALFDDLYAELRRRPTHPTSHRRQRR